MPGEKDVRAFHIKPSWPVPSNTFHGRDVFAPAAAALATGRALSDLGAEVADPALLGGPAALRAADGAGGEVVGVDRFENATTNLPGAWVTPRDRVEVAGRRLAVRRTYGDAQSGEALALVDSEGWIELAVRDGSAAERLGLTEGTVVRVRRP